MKKLYFITIILLCMMIVFQSCSKQSKDMIAPVSPTVINVTIAPNQAYTFTPQGSGNVAIEKQASHYKISKAGPDEKSGQVVYQYTPAPDYIGKDEVVLSSKRTVISTGGSSGCNNSNRTDVSGDISGTTSYSNTSYTTIRLTIAN